MLSKTDKETYAQILAQIKNDSAKVFTQDDYSRYLGVSRRKFSDFANLKIYDIELLIQYATINGFKFVFSIREANVFEL